MLLAIFIISIALGTISKLQFWVIQFGSSADCASMPCTVLIVIDRACLMNLSVKIIFALHL